MTILCNAKGHGDQTSVPGPGLKLVRQCPQIPNTVKKCFASCAAFWHVGPTVCLSNRVVVQCKASEITLWAGEL